MAHDKDDKVAVPPAIDGGQDQARPYGDPDEDSLLDDFDRFSVIWLVPIIALLVAVWLVWQSYAKAGPEITITFANSEGIQIGKSTIRHLDVQLGTVESVMPTKDFSNVIVHAKMSKIAELFLKSGTRFWIVRPRLSVEGISGLGTIVTGSYIELDPGQGDPAQSFTGLDSPPVTPTTSHGRSYTLHATELNSIEQGSPLYFHGVKVGEIMGYDVSDKDGTMLVHAFVEEPHEQLVHQGTHFWNTSGLNFTLGGDGLHIETPSLAAMIVGGVSFDVPEGVEAGPVADANTEFTLYPSRSASDDAIYSQKIGFLLHFEGPLTGLRQNADVEMRGMKIGHVADVHIEYDPAADKLTMPVIIEIESQRIKMAHASDSAPPTDEHRKAESYAIFRQLVAQGLRAQLASNSLVTGQKMVDLDFVPGAAPAQVTDGEPFPELPTVEGEDLDSLMHVAHSLLTEMKGLVTNVNTIVASPQTKHSLESLDHTLANLDKVTHETSVNIGPILKSLRSAASSVDQALGANADNGGADLAGTFRELKDAARSVRALADYLERHPEALISGKPAQSEDK